MAMAPSPSQKRWMRAETSLVPIVTRRAPCTVPPDATGTATYRMSVAKVSEDRVPVDRMPLSASAISGRVEKSRSVGPPVSTIEMPSRSTTTTLAPVRSLYSLAGAGSSGRSFSRSSS